MSTPELVSYIQQHLTKKIPEKLIRETLSRAGWKNKDIDEGFSKAYQKPSISSPTNNQEESLEGFNTFFTPLKITEHDLSGSVTEPPSSVQKSLGKVFVALIIILVFLAGLYFYFPLFHTLIADLF